MGLPRRDRLPIRRFTERPAQKPQRHGRATQAGHQRSSRTRPTRILLPRRANTTVELETLLATGDNDRITATDTVGGNRVGTTDTGFNSLGFANTGLAFAPALTNLAAVRLGARSSPFPEGDAFDRLRLGADAFVFFKMDSNAPIDEPTSDDAWLGFEIDFFATWRITSDLSIGARYGLFVPGSAIENDDLRHFVLFNVTLAF